MITQYIVIVNMLRAIMNEILSLLVERGRKKRGVLPL